MRKNKIYIIVISVLVIILIGVIGLIILTKKTVTAEEEDISKINPNEEIVYVCETEQGENYDDFKIYTIENVTVKKGQVLKTQTGTKIVYKTQSFYKNAKIDNSEKTSEYDDKELSILEMNKEYNDYTKDDTGKEINVTYEEYQQFLSDLGYICKKKS